ncbi:GIY-YIG nuclease family protein [Bacillus cereus group sp. N21]|uniref:GIY-YIG nuclease family protein n=1 Tax=Bacillus cereus group sp. N21 TaxID=2794591 RepID=UPI0018F5A4AF|nr:GIY-YIG nuclease family protein [Bacillus cereus group sp. N21]MBJ8031111.1 GIY-YIG nuclease family protein [Bacillus cereus group sp. N21]
MFGTIIQDAYIRDETEQIADALEDICNSRNNYGWSSAGIYCFWNYTTKEVLYIGLAVDLLTRFKQHNGIIAMDANGCKFEKIQEYFKTHEKIGYSVFVQSSHHQPVYSENRTEWKQFNPTQFPNTQSASEDIKIAEGILIETYKMRHGVLPPWNRVGGSKEGQKVAKPGNYIFIDSLKYPESSPFTAKHTLREISSNATYLAFEEFLHSARMMMGIKITFNEALEIIKMFDDFTYNRIIKDGYLNHKLSF